MADALLDSNVIIASIAPIHPHHMQSLSRFGLVPRVSYAIAAQSFAEAYVTLTRKGAAFPFRLTSKEAWAALESLRARTGLVGLTPAQSLDTLRNYVARGGIGPRLYDALIGKTAVLHAVPTIISWNRTHMLGLFPALTISTPAEFLSRHLA